MLTFKRKKNILNSNCHAIQQHVNYNSYLLRIIWRVQDDIINMLEFLIDNIVVVFAWVWEFPGPDVSRWTWDQRHCRQQHLCFLPGFTSVDRERRSTSHFHLWQTRRFQFPHFKFSVPEKQYSSFARLLRLYLAAYTMCPGLFLICMFYFELEGDASFK